MYCQTAARICRCFSAASKSFLSISIPKCSFSNIIRRLFICSHAMGYDGLDVSIVVQSTAVVSGCDFRSPMSL